MTRDNSDPQRLIFGMKPLSWILSRLQDVCKKIQSENSNTHTEESRYTCHTPKALSDWRICPCPGNGWNSHALSLTGVSLLVCLFLPLHRRHCELPQRTDILRWKSFHILKHWRPQFESPKATSNADQGQSKSVNFSASVQVKTSSWPSSSGAQP